MCKNKTCADGRPAKKFSQCAPHIACLLEEWSAAQVEGHTHREDLWSILNETTSVPNFGVPPIKTDM